MTDLLEILTIRTPESSKFKVLDQPYSLPSKCSFCGIGHNEDGKRQFIDTMLELDYYGVVYICSTCFIEIAKALGFLSPQQYTRVADAGIAAELQNRELKVENDGLRNAIAILSSHRCLGPTSLSHVVNEQGEGEDDSIPPGSLETGESEGSDNAKPDDGERLSDVRGDAKPDGPKPAKRTTYLDDLLEGIHPKG